MNGVIGMAELLQRSNLPDRERMFSDTIHKSGMALLTIVNDILDFSKIEAGKLELDPTPFNMHEAVDDVAMLLGGAAREKNIDLLVRFHPRTPKFVVGDVGRIRQILTNLVGNAIKFTHEGSVLIDVSGDPSGDTAALSIKIADTGIGIAQEKADRIFEKFTQAEGSTTRRYGGTGLGLTITRDLIEAMAGSIKLDSVLGEGSTFTLTLTLPIDADGAGRQAHVSSKLSKLAGVRALIVDDLEVNRTILSEMLSEQSIEVYSADSADAAMKLVDGPASTEFDIAVTDFQMPDIDGHGLVSKLRETPQTETLPILVLSSVDEMKTRQSFGSFENVQFLTKPARSVAILNAIAHLIDKTPCDDSVDATTPQQDEEERQALHEDFEKPKVLIAEDNQVNRLVIENMIDTDRYAITFAEDGKIALDLYKTGAFDVVLMDISMPVMDGEQATKAIRAFEAAQNRPQTPIVALTAHAMDGDRDRLMAQDFTDYLAKPVKKTLIDDLLKRYTDLPASPPQQERQAQAE